MTAPVDRTRQDTAGRMAGWCPVADATGPRCRSRSEFGDCWRPQRHTGPHAVPIDGDDFVFGYLRGGKALGYGHMHDDEFVRSLEWCEVCDSSS